MEKLSKDVLERVHDVSDSDLPISDTDIQILGVYRPQGEDGDRVLVKWTSHDDISSSRLDLFRDGDDLFTTGFFDRDATRGDHSWEAMIENLGVDVGEHGIDGWIGAYADAVEDRWVTHKARLVSEMARILAAHPSYRTFHEQQERPANELYREARIDARYVLSEERVTDGRNRIPMELAVEIFEDDLVRRISLREIGDPLTVLCYCPENNDWRVNESPEGAFTFPIQRQNLVWRPKRPIKSELQEDPPIWMGFAEFLKKPDSLMGNYVYRVRMDPKFGGEESPALENLEDVETWVRSMLPETAETLLEKYPDLRSVMLRRRIIDMAADDLDTINAIHDGEMRIVSAALFARDEDGDYQEVSDSSADVCGVLGSAYAEEVAEDLLGEVISMVNARTPNPQADCEPA
ncbi:hypothetical protein [Thioalkalivibrio sp. ALE19]|uniref:hypothetical protein n=1 Tax=Thioalkalivibrio sp. ALE19 TaxID=1266909 RepID=UPI000490D25B|nr:hypothetical protein [Thioalkalivibrio sp. ALE19]